VKRMRRLSLLLLVLALVWFGLALAGVPVRDYIVDGWRELEQDLHGWVLARRNAAVTEGEDDDAPGAGSPAADGHGPVPEEVAQVRPGTVRMPPDLQRISGLQTQVLRAMRYLPEFSAYAEVLDPAPLIRLRNDWLAGRADLALLQSALRLSSRELKRIRLLQQADANVSVKTLQQAEAQARADQLRVAAARIRRQGLRAAAEQHWGRVLIAAILDDDLAWGQALRQGREVLLRVVMPAGARMPDSAERISVSPDGEREQSAPAHRISPAPRTDTWLQGESWFFHTAAARLRIGMRLSAWGPRRSQAETGVRVPARAAIWYAGQPWVYVRSSPETFVRQAIGDGRELGDGWFVRAGLRAGAEVVTQGAQMLLSEEFRWQIPNEDDD